MADPKGNEGGEGSRTELGQRRKAPAIHILRRKDVASPLCVQGGWAALSWSPRVWQDRNQLCRAHGKGSPLLTANCVHLPLSPSQQAGEWGIAGQPLFSAVCPSVLAPCFAWWLFEAPGRPKRSPCPNLCPSSLPFSNLPTLQPWEALKCKLGLKNLP